MDILVREVLFHELRHNLSRMDDERFRRLIRRTPLLQLAFASAVFLIFSLIFLRAEKLLGGGEVVFTSIVASMLVFMLLLSALLAVEFLHALGKTRALAPLLSHPLRLTLLPFRAWLLYYASPLLFMMLPFYWQGLSYGFEVFIVELLWSAVSIFLGYAIGAFFALLAFRMKKRSPLWAFLRLLGLGTAGLAVMLFIFYGILFPQAFTGITALKLSSYLFPVVQSLSVYYAVEGIIRWPPLGAYLTLSVALFALANLLVERRLIEGVYTGKTGGEFKASPTSSMGALVLKDLKLASRRTSSLFITLLPVVFLLPMVFLERGDPVTWTLIVGSTALMEALNTQVLLIEEHKSGWFLFSLPLTEKDFRNAKSLTVALLYTPSLLVGLAVARYNGASTLPYLALFGVLSNLLMAKFMTLWLTRGAKGEYTFMPAYLTIGDNLVIFGLAALLVNTPALLLRFTHRFLGPLLGYAFLVLEAFILVLLWRED
ncbi:hypothetical protein [Palaeococcus ferrophilus]|uniref:hypothetical protein n=1 Tax=Palaeococcus ferrophilus TaxID=83868 RepID=UPI00064E64E3|nr:hypothetical protein [Palaeococcus ferrophilus]